eukprot:3200978-Rhodomonas_salina.1
MPSFEPKSSDHGICPTHPLSRCKTYLEGTYMVPRKVPTWYLTPEKQPCPTRYLPGTNMVPTWQQGTLKAS